MNIFQITNNDLKVLLIIRPPFTLLLCFVLFGKDYFLKTEIFIPVTIVAILMTITTWLLHIFADHSMRQKYFNHQKTTKRILFTILFHFCIGTIFINLLLYWGNTISFLGYSFANSTYMLALLVVFCTNIAASGFHEGVYMFENWKKTLIESQELKKLTLKNRLYQLRNQTNPHFFFNSINSLSELIERDTAQADYFLNELCIVYRYLLREEEEVFSTLKNELTYLKSWIHIVETRSGNTLKISINIDQYSDTYLIPRLTLLNYLENIIDNYIINKNERFHLIITQQGDRLDLTHPMSRIKIKRQNRSNQQIEEVKTIFKLLNLPEIIEKNYDSLKIISIPLYTNINN